MLKREKVKDIRASKTVKAAFAEVSVNEQTSLVELMIEHARLKAAISMIISELEDVDISTPLPGF